MRSNESYCPSWLLVGAMLLLGGTPALAQDTSLEEQVRQLEERALRSSSSLDLQEAVEAMTRLMQGQPTADLYRRRAALRERLRDPRGAIEDYTAAYALEPTQVRDLISRGKIRQLLGEHEAALKDFTEAVERAGDLESAGLAQFTLAHARYRTGDYAGAIREYSSVLQKDPSWVERNGARIHRTLGDLQSLLMRFDDAIASYGRYLDHDSDGWRDVVAVLEKRARLKDAQGDRTGARQDRERAAEIEKARKEEEARDHHADYHGKATPITPGLPVRGAVDFPRDHDWFSIHLQRGQPYVFSLPKLDGIAPRLVIYDTDGRTVLPTHPSPGATAGVVFTPGRSGKYFVVVSGSDDRGTYELLTAREAPVESPEPDLPPPPPPSPEQTPTPKETGEVEACSAKGKHLGTFWIHTRGIVGRAVVKETSVVARWTQGGRVRVVVGSVLSNRRGVLRWSYSRRVGSTGIAGRVRGRKGRMGRGAYRVVVVMRWRNGGYVGRIEGVRQRWVSAIPTQRGREKAPISILLQRDGAGRPIVDLPLGE